MPRRPLRLFGSKRSTVDVDGGMNERTNDRIGQDRIGWDRDGGWVRREREEGKGR
jgi:hypothetical protein